MDSSYEVENNTKSFMDSSYEHQIPNVGKFNCPKYDFKKGLFEFKFTAIEKFCGTVKIKVFALGKNVPRYKQEKYKCENDIEKF